MQRSVYNFYEWKSIILPTALYGSRHLVWEVLREGKCLRSLVGVSQMDWVRNTQVHWQPWIERELVSIVDQSVGLDVWRKWCWYWKWKEVSVWGRLSLGWMNDVKVALGSRATFCTLTRSLHRHSSVAQGHLHTIHPV